jgi:hypothetical protein
MAGFFYHPPPGYPVVVTEDHGGFVSSYEDAVAIYNREGRRVEIRGSCNSACTLALAVHNVCVGKDAVVRWHQAYEPNTNRLRPDVTKHMIDVLPPRLRNYLDGKIKENYTPETTLHFEELVSLGIPDCDAPSYKAHTVTANVDYGRISNSISPRNTVSNTQPEYVPQSAAEQKEVDWAKYWGWAADISRKQFGSIKSKKYDFGKGKASVSIYYWDRQGMYVTAIQYTQNGIPGERKVCRAEEVVPDEMTCTDWMTGQSKTLELDDFTGRYEEVTG